MSELHAILIGIDAYLENWLDGVGRYPPLDSCVRDVSRVEEYLRAYLNLAPERITKLTATRPALSIDVVPSQGSPVESLLPTEPREKWPTYENIVSAFTSVSTSASPGDHVFIFYAGHGGRTKTIYPERKGSEGLDQVLVPMDIGDHHLRYLRDVEVAHLLRRMGERRLRVTLFLDSSNSGGEAVRNRKLARGFRERGGLSPVDTAQSPPATVAPRQVLRSSRRSNFSAKTPWLPGFSGQVLFAASRPEEPAFEYNFEDSGRGGVFTYCFLHALKQLKPGTTYRELFSNLLAEFNSLGFRQTPMLLGDVQAEVFGLGVTAGMSGRQTSGSAEPKVLTGNSQTLPSQSLSAELLVHKNLVLEVAFRLVIGRHAPPDLLVHLDPAKLRSAAETLLRQSSSHPEPLTDDWLAAARDLLAAQQPGIDPNPLWLSWMTTAQSKLLESFISSPVS